VPLTSQIGFRFTGQKNFHLESITKQSTDLSIVLNLSLGRAMASSPGDLTKSQFVQLGNNVTCCDWPA